MREDEKGFFFVGNRKGAKVFDLHSTFKAQENQRFLANVKCKQYKFYRR